MLASLWTPPHPRAPPSNDFALALGVTEKGQWQRGGSSQRSAGAEPPRGRIVQGAVPRRGRPGLAAPLRLLGRRSGARDTGEPLRGHLFYRPK